VDASVTSTDARSTLITEVKSIPFVVKSKVMVSAAFAPT
jgi:hypothetical protein